MFLKPGAQDRECRGVKWRLNAEKSLRAEGKLLKRARFIDRCTTTTGGLMWKSGSGAESKIQVLCAKKFAMCKVEAELKAVLCNVQQ